jgi:hypothetical protein
VSSRAVRANSSTDPLTGGEEGGHLFLEYLSVSADSPENHYRSVSCRVASSFSWVVVVVETVLILAREEVVAALLGMMVELKGLQPRFLRAAEAAEDAILRERPGTVIIDCDHPDCRDDLVESIVRAGAVPILFSPFRMQAEVRSAAARHGIRSFTLPTDTDTFGRMLDS